MKKFMIYASLTAGESLRTLSYSALRRLCNEQQKAVWPS